MPPSGLPSPLSTGRVLDLARCEVRTPQIDELEMEPCLGHPEPLVLCILFGRGLSIHLYRLYRGT